jgi:hypothetical protein
MERISTKVTIGLIGTDPAAAMGQLAAELWRLRDRMHPAETLVYTCGDLEFTVGRHEVPALAMLFGAWDADPGLSETALDRARGYVSTGRLSG